ncbi:unnamed protein product [Penicillium salamii]|nr:unnamed protein product [Penicillium salamii]
MLAIRHTAALRTRATLIAARQQSHRPVSRLLSTSTPKTPQRWGNAWKWKIVSNKKMAFALISGSTSAAVLGLVLANVGKSADHVNSHDVKALALIPFGKLFTGWMWVAQCAGPVFYLVTNC